MEKFGYQSTVSVTVFIVWGSVAILGFLATLIFRKKLGQIYRALPGSFLILALGVLSSSVLSSYMELEYTRKFAELMISSLDKVEIADSNAYRKLLFRYELLNPVNIFWLGFVFSFVIAILFLGYGKKKKNSTKV